MDLPVTTAVKPVRRTPGEPMVWVTAMGLAIGLAMVAGLLGVIVWHGIGVFWPKRIELFRLVAADAGTTTVGGVVVKRQDKSPEIGKPPVPEIQIYTGNRDVYGLAFRYLDVANIAGSSRPDDALVVERMQNGNLLGQPARIELKGGQSVDAADPEFTSRLDTLLAEATRRRAEIHHLEKQVIGANASQIRQLETRLRAAAPGSNEVQQDQARLASLKATYAELSASAKELRGHQNDHHLVVRLFTGEQKSVPLGEVVSFHFPNRMGFTARAVAFFANAWGFVSGSPRESNTEGGIFPAIFGTFVMTLLMSVVVVPFGVVAAIYLREYAKQGPVVRAVRIAVNNLAGVPSIVFGVFGLGFFVYVVGGSIDRAFFSQNLPNPTFGTGGIGWAALTLALMTVPVVIVATEESIAAVPRGAREGSLACGASKWQTIRSIVLPAAVPGILTGLILAMARGAGEVAPLMLVGVVKLAPSLPVDLEYPFVHLDQKFMHLGFHIYDLGFQSPDSEAAKPMVFATTLFLILLVVVLNLGAIMLRERLRRRFATSTF